MPLPGLPWSREFMEAYDAALNQSAPVMVIGASRSPPGTVAEAVARYLGSATFTNNFKPATQAMRRAVLNRFRNEHGDKRIGKLEPQYVMRLVLRLRPYAQRNMLKTLRGLMAFAVTEGLIEADPTVGVKLGKVKDTGGFATWSPEHVEQYRARHPLGTRPRLAMELGLGTMQRRGDAVRFGRQHIRDGILSLKQNKTGAEVDIPVLDELREAIDAMSDANLTFLVTEFGKPFTAAGFGNWFRDQCNAAGLPKTLSFHGLRKAGATRFAEAGCNDHEIMSWGGWTSLREVQRYTRGVNRKQLAMQAADKLKARTKVTNLDAELVKKPKNG